MNGISARSRQPAGVAAGGQFATEPRSEASVSLAGHALTKDDYGRFSTAEGQAELALALHEATGWPLVAPPADSTSTWVAVRSPNGRILSLAGADSETTWLNRARSAHPGDPITRRVCEVELDEARGRLSADRKGAPGLRAREVANLLVAKNASDLTDPYPPIGEADEDTYTGSMCYQLANELHQATGWPVVVVGDGPQGSVGWVHAGVRRPDGKIVDVRGAHDEVEWIDQWAEWVDAYGEDEDDYDGDDVGVNGLDEYGTAHIPDDPYEGFGDADRARTRQVAQMLAAEHS